MIQTRASVGPPDVHLGAAQFLQVRDGIAGRSPSESNATSVSPVPLSGTALSSLPWSEPRFDKSGKPAAFGRKAMAALAGSSSIKEKTGSSESPHDLRTARLALHPHQQPRFTAGAAAVAAPAPMPLPTSRRRPAARYPRRSYSRTLSRDRGFQSDCGCARAADPVPERIQQRRADAAAHQVRGDAHRADPGRRAPPVPDGVRDPAAAVFGEGEAQVGRHPPEVVSPALWRGYAKGVRPAHRCVRERILVHLCDSHKVGGLHFRISNLCTPFASSTTTRPSTATRAGFAFRQEFGQPMAI